MHVHNNPGAAVGVSVLVPYRGDDGGARDDAWAFIRDWWATHHPDWPLTQGHPGAGPWSKGAAVADALRRHPPAPGAVLVIADADVICPGIERAVAAVTAGAMWAKPHWRVYRLSEAATRAVYAGGPLPDPSRAVARRHPTQRPAGPFVESYAGIPGGGITVLPAARYQQAPLDPRFHGWGQEDAAWGHALTVQFGHPWTGSADLYHLWHPPPVRAGRQEPVAGQATQMSRSIGNPAGLDLYHRYQAAKTPAAVRAIIADIHNHLDG
jgi:hypothetical protein